jgi:hypothetical protein
MKHSGQIRTLERQLPLLDRPAMLVFLHKPDGLFHTEIDGEIRALTEKQRREVIDALPDNAPIPITLRQYYESEA